MDSEPDLETQRRDIYHIAFLLRQRLPPELIPDILNQAECWVKQTTEAAYSLCIDESQSRDQDGHFVGRCYLDSTGIDTETLSGRNPFTKIVFTIVSKDQGRSSFPHDHGSYRNSWTWFDAVAKHQKDGVDLAVKSKRICTNVHAGSEYKTHVAEWFVNGEDAEERMWVKALQRGQIISINAFALYPGWRNQVESAKMEIWISAIR